MSWIMDGEGSGRCGGIETWRLIRKDTYWLKRGIIKGNVMREVGRYAKAPSPLICRNG